MAEMCVGPKGGQPCGRELPPRLPGTRGRKRVRCDICAYRVSHRDSARKAKVLEDLEGEKEAPIHGVVLPVELVEPEARSVAPKVKNYCRWLGHNGDFCDKLLIDEEFFCSDHGMPPRSVFVPAQAFSGPGVMRMQENTLEYEPGPLEMAHLRALTAIGKAFSPDGILVLMTARRLDQGVTDSALPNTVLQLRKAAEAVYAGAPPLPGEIDEIRARREAKAAAAEEVVNE